jgi:hypothetical protein
MYFKDEKEGNFIISEKISGDKKTLIRLKESNTRSEILQLNQNPE